MNTLVQAFKALLGLFFDDGSLALALVALLGSLMLLAQAGLASPLIMMVLLVVGTLTLLLENVIRTARRHRR